MNLSLYTGEMLNIIPETLRTIDFKFNHPKRENIWRVKERFRDVLTTYSYEVFVCLRV